MAAFDCLAGAGAAGDQRVAREGLERLRRLTAERARWHGPAAALASRDTEPLPAPS